MATKWIREVSNANSGRSTGVPFAMKTLVLFLKEVLGFTVTEDNAATRSGAASWVSAGGGNWTLTATGGDWDQLGGVEPALSISGSANPANNGIFNIVSISSRTTCVYFNPTVGATSGTGTWGAWNLGSYTATAKSGSNGAFSGTSKSFTDAVYAGFDASDAGRWIVIAGSSRNAGVYQIASYVSPTEVVINYRSAATEYPEADTGMRWSIFPATGVGGVAVRSGSYARLRTPHASAWEVELAYDNMSYARVSVRVATDGNWAGTKIIGPVYYGSADSKSCYSYCAGESDGSAIHMMLHQSTDNKHNGAFVCHITPCEPGHDTVEKIALMGNIGTAVTDGDNGNLSHNYDSKRVGHGYVWKSWADAQRDVYMTQFSYAGGSNGLEKWVSREKNRRRSGSGYGLGDSFALVGTTITLTDVGAAFVASDVGKTIKIEGATTLGNNGLFVITSRISGTQITYENASGFTEAYAGTWTIADFQDMVIGTQITLDVTNVNGEFELLGRLQGHYGVRSSLSIRTPFSESAPHARDKLHMADGFAFDWFDLTPQH